MIELKNCVAIEALEARSLFDAVPVSGILLYVDTMLNDMTTMQATCSNAVINIRIANPAGAPGRKALNKSINQLGADLLTGYTKLYADSLTIPASPTLSDQQTWENVLTSDIKAIRSQFKLDLSNVDARLSKHPELTAPSYVQDNINLLQSEVVTFKADVKTAKAFLAYPVN